MKHPPCKCISYSTSDFSIGMVGYQTTTAVLKVSWVNYLGWVFPGICLLDIDTNTWVRQHRQESPSFQPLDKIMYHTILGFKHGVF